MRQSKLLLVLGVLLSGCGNSEDAPDTLPSAPTFPVPGCEAFSHAPCDIREAPCQTRLFELARCLRGSDPGEPPPPVRVVSESEYASYLRESIEPDAEPESDYDPWERAFQLLGLVQAGDFGTDESIERTVSMIYGLFRSEQRDIWLIDHGRLAELDLSSAVLVHEFVHALQDREVNLSAFQEEHFTSFEATLGARAVIEGEARVHEARYWAALLGLNPAEVNWAK